MGPEEVVPVEFTTILKDKTGKFNSILVGVRTLKDKIRLMKKNNELGDIFLEQLGFDISKIKNAPVFLSDHLIPTIYGLLREARGSLKNMDSNLFGVEAVLFLFRRKRIPRSS